ncbi:MAG: hypothetical protein KAV00_16440, partial [Phycisphaerae bacterium]|nr:hypothetical protein [Phycisphaerae bacterium]
IFPGCNSSKAMAEPFAKSILRVGAHAQGTNQLIGTWDGQLHWDWHKNADGKLAPQSHGKWKTAPVWVKHKGVN